MKWIGVICGVVFLSCTVWASEDVDPSSVSIFRVLSA